MLHVRISFRMEPLTVQWDCCAGVLSDLVGWVVRLAFRVAGVVLCAIRVAAQH